MSRNYASWPWLTTYSTHSTMCVTLSQSYQTLISSFYRFLLLSLTISKYRQCFLMLQTLKLNNGKWKKSLFYEEKSLVGLTPSVLPNQMS